MTQSNTRTGSFPVLAGEDLTAKEGYLVKMTHDTGVPEVKLPAAITDITPYVVGDGAGDTKLAEVIPIVAERNVRLKLKGTCNPGDQLVLAAIAGSDAGMVRLIPVAAGTYRVIAIAEEAGVDGQLVLCRPYMVGNVTISGT
jgi:N-acetylglutamate synthase/N-acetylornithine aminotransferase